MHMLVWWGGVLGKVLQLVHFGTLLDYRMHTGLRYIPL